MREMRRALLLKRTCYRAGGDRDAPDQEIQGDQGVITEQCRYRPQDKRDLVDDLPDQAGVEPGRRVDEERVFVLCHIPLTEIGGEFWSDRVGESMGKVHDWKGSMIAACNLERSNAY
jgi:hypothetical protein